MIVVCTGVAVIEHRSTEEQFEIDASELDWDSEGHDERNMGPEIRHFADVSHSDLGDLTWEIYEYPVGVQNLADRHLNGHVLITDLSYHLEHVESDEE